MKKLDLITIGLIVIFIIFLIGIGVLFNYFLKKTSIPEIKKPSTPVTQIPSINVYEREATVSPAIQTETTSKESEITIQTTTQTTTPSQEEIKLRKILKNQVLTFHLYDDKLYFYDIEDKTLKYYDFKNDLIIPIYKNEKITKVIWGPKDNYFIFKTKEGNFIMLDYLNDNLYTLPSDISEVIFFNNNLLAYFKNKAQNYLGLLDLKGKFIKKIIDINFEEIKIVPLSLDEVLIFELPSDNVLSYLWLLNIKNQTLKVIFKESAGLFALGVDKQILVSQSQESTTQIINSQGQNITSLPYVSAMEKCTVSNYIICAITNSISIDDWYNFQISSDDSSLFVYNPKNKNYDLINLENQFDILYPQIKSNYLYFIDRSDWSLYQYELEKIF